MLFYDHLQEDEVPSPSRCSTTVARPVYAACFAVAAGAAGPSTTGKRFKRSSLTDGTWYGRDRVGAIQLQGVSARLDQLFLSEAAFMTWLDCLVAQPNPKQKDIDKILDPTVRTQGASGTAM